MGEFQHASGFNVSRQEPGLDSDGPTKDRLHREALFLRAVFEVEPATRDSLEEILHSLKQPAAGVKLPEIPKEQVRQWSNRWNLRAPWCEEAAEQFILTWWLESQPGGEIYSMEALHDRVAAQELAAQPFQAHHFVVDFGAWPITQITEREFREQCQNIFKREIDLFIKEIEQLRLDAGMERTREKREDAHFFWLARHLVKGETADDIRRFSAKMANSSRRAITKAIATLARELDLPLDRKDPISD